MTTADLGRQLKAIHHPHYADVPNHQLGLALKSKYPGIYDHIPDGNLDDNTTPETPKTLQIQLDQLAQGLRRVVMVARGSKLKIDPKEYGARKVLLPPGEFIYDPSAINANEIIAAVRDHTLEQILGTTDKGYGTPDKEDLQGEPMAVVARDQDGETAHSALTDKDHADTAIAAAHDLMPQGGQVTVEPPHLEITHRVRAGDKWPKKPTQKVKLPPGETA